VRLIDEKKEQVGVVPLSKALTLAREKGLDLVEVAQKARPPVCRIMDFGKFKYQETKKQKKQNKTQQLKHVRLHIGTDKHDLEIKAKQAGKWLKNGNKVRIQVQLRGREKAHQDVAHNKIKNFIKQIQEIEPKQGIKLSQPIKKTPQGLQVLITKK